MQIGLGETIRENAWGRDRKYVVAFLSGASPQHPLVELVAADDFEDTRELVAVIRGSDGVRRMYGIGDKLPAVYVERLRTQIYNERVVHPGVWNKVVVVANEDDHETMLNHALIQKPAALLDLGHRPSCPPRRNQGRSRGYLAEPHVSVSALTHNRLCVSASRFSGGRSSVSRSALGQLFLARDLGTASDVATALLRRLTTHKVKRLPVLAANKRLCGMITEADIAMHIPQEKTGEMVGAIAAAQPQHF